MIHKIIISISAVLVLSCWGSAIYAQDFFLPIEEHKQSFISFDSLVGMENLEIFNGIEYIEKHRMLNEKHKFYQSFDFQKGTVYYSGQPFFNINMKYNIVDDVVLVQRENKGSGNVIQLYSEKLDGFSIFGKRFLNISGNEELPARGIFEIIFETPGAMVLKKHQMKEKKILEGKLLHYEFEKDDSRFFYVHKGELKEMNRENLVQSFPGKKEKIRRYFRTQRRKLRNDPALYRINIFKELTKEPLSE